VITKRCLLSQPNYKIPIFRIFRFRLLFCKIIPEKKFSRYFFNPVNMWKSTKYMEIQGVAYKDGPENIFLHKWTGQNRTCDTFVGVFRTARIFLGFFDFNSFLNRF